MGVLRRMEVIGIGGFAAITDTRLNLCICGGRD